MLNFLIEKIMTYASTSPEIKITHILENINTVLKKLNYETSYLHLMSCHNNIHLYF